MKEAFFRRIAAPLATALLLGLCACSEKPQALGGMPKSDKPAYTGTGVSAFTRPGWQAGDATSWREQLKSRGQYGMNDHSRSP